MHYRILSGIVFPLISAQQKGHAKIYFYPFSIRGDVDLKQSAIHQTIGESCAFISPPVLQTSVQKVDFIDNDRTTIFSHDRNSLESWEITESVDQSGRYINIYWEACSSTKIHQISWLVIGETGHSILLANEKQPQATRPVLGKANNGKQSADKNTDALTTAGRKHMSTDINTSPKQSPQDPKDQDCGLGKYKAQKEGVSCTDIGKLSSCVLEDNCDKSFTLHSNKKCPSCCDAETPNLDPCISISWGDGSHDCMETDDTETLCITVWNPYTNVIFRDVTIEFAVVNPNATLPNGSQAITIVPDRKVCFGDLWACEKKGGEERVTREVTLTSCGAKEGHYNIYIGACFSVEIPNQATLQCFPIKLTSS